MSKIRVSFIMDDILFFVSVSICRGHYAIKSYDRQPTIECNPPEDFFAKENPQNGQKVKTLTLLAGE
jgi:hypothetical protein